MGKKKTSKFCIEYGKSKNCSDCKYNSCEWYMEKANFPGSFRRLRHLIYCIKCSLSSTKNGFIHKTRYF